MRLLRAVTALVLLISVACTSDAAQVDDTDASTPVVSTVPEVELSPGQELRTIARTFQSGRFLVTVGHVVVDRSEKAIHVGLRFENLSERWEAVPGDGILEVDGRELYVFLDSSARIPPGASADVTGRVDVGDSPIDGATLVWGRPDETRNRLPLDGGPPEGFGVAVEVPVDEWGQIGRHAVHVSAAWLHADALRAPRAETGQHVLRVLFDEYTSASTVVNGFWPVAHLRLRWPDGTEVEPLSGSTGRAPLSWTTSTAMSVDLPVPAEASGDYELLLSSVSRDAFAVFHPDLVERVSLPITIPPLDLGPAATSPLVQLPRPTVVPPDPSLARAVERDLDVPEVNTPGFVFRATAVRWDPDLATVSLDGLVRLVPPVVPDDGGLLSVPVQFAPTTALLVDGRVHGGLMSSTIPTVTGDEALPVSFEFPRVDRFDADTAVLVLGEDWMPPSTVPLGPESPLPLDPPAPVERAIDAPEITAGNYVVQLVAYRFGFPRRTDRPPAGWRSLEIIADVTAREVEAPGAFGLGFSARTQLFLTREDGWLQQSEASDTVALEPDETARIGATFRVPADWRPGTTTFTVRSLDEITAITRDSWVEVTFTAELADDEGRTG